jgi:MFS superfamily sulfate permease-like transporter
VAWLTASRPPAAGGRRAAGAGHRPRLPATDWRQITDLLPAAFVLALVSFLEAMSSCKIAAARTGQRWDGNQELIGQGLAKLTAAVCQAYPVSGSFGRSAFLLGPAPAPAWPRWSAR